MGAASKFMFDTDFARYGEGSSRAGGHAHQPAALADAEARGYARGCLAGKAEALADSERRLTVALAQASDALRTIAGSLGATEARLEAECAELAVTVAGKLAAAFVERDPFAGIAALSRDCFCHLIGKPHVVVRVHDTIYEDARIRLETIARDSGFDGRLIVLAEADLGVGDCRVEWADGGAVLNAAAVKQSIADAVSRFLSGSRTFEDQMSSGEA